MRSALARARRIKCDMGRSSDSTNTSLPMPLSNDSDTKPELHLDGGTIAIVPGCALWPSSVPFPVEDDDSGEDYDSEDAEDYEDYDEDPPQRFLRGLPVREDDDAGVVSESRHPEPVQGDQWSCAASVDDESERSERSESSRPSTAFSIRNAAAGAAGDPNSEDWEEQYHDAGPRGAEEGIRSRRSLQSTIVISSAWGGEAAREAANAAMAQMNQVESMRSRASRTWLRGAVRPKRRIIEVRALSSVF